MKIPRTCLVPAGEFAMGAGDDDKFATDAERPRHLARIERPFRLATFPTTVAEYRAFDASHAPHEAGDIPAVNISWADARAYCAWLGAESGGRWRLPSEEEWEYACRAGTDTPFFSGDTLPPTHANYLYDEQGNPVGRNVRTPEGTFPPNAFGLEDMHGNVCEWCEDAWSPSYEDASIDPARRVIRGGAWDYLPRLLRSSWRDALPMHTRRDNVGFRVACDPS